MKIRDDVFIYYARQNGKYNLSLKQLLERIDKIQKYNSQHKSLQQVQNVKSR